MASGSGSARENAIFIDDDNHHDDGNDAQMMDVDVEEEDSADRNRWDVMNTRSEHPDEAYGDDDNNGDDDDDDRWIRYQAGVQPQQRRQQRQQQRDHLNGRGRDPLRCGEYIKYISSEPYS